MVKLGSEVGVAFALSIGAGLATCIGGLIIFFKRLIRLASPKTLSIALSLSAGVMIFISLVEIFGKSVESYQSGFTVTLKNNTFSCGELGLKFINKTKDGNYYCSSCDTLCEGHSWLATTATFILGVLIIFGMDFVVEKISPAAHEELEVSHLDKLQSTITESVEGKGQSTSSSIESVVDEHGLKEKSEGLSNPTKSQLNRTGIVTAIAIGLHNIPEGVATYIAAIGDTRVGAALAIGVALHNIPEGIAVATPVYFATGSALRAFLWTFVSALAEPLGAILAWLIIGNGLNPHVEGVMFGIVCGMMTTISFKELIPNAIKFYSKGNTVIFSILGGMGIMVISLILFAYAGV